MYKALSAWWSMVREFRDNLFEMLIAFRSTIDIIVIEIHPLNVLKIIEDDDSAVADFERKNPAQAFFIQSSC